MAPGQSHQPQLQPREPNIRVVDITIPPQNPALRLTFPLKCYVTCDIAKRVGRMRRRGHSAGRYLNNAAAERTEKVAGHADLADAPEPIKQCPHMGGLRSCRGIPQPGEWRRDAAAGVSGTSDRIIRRPFGRNSTRSIIVLSKSPLPASASRHRPADSAVSALLQP